MRNAKKEIYSFVPRPKPKKFIFIDKEYKAIYNKIKFTPRKIDELVALRFNRNTLIYYKHIGLFALDSSKRLYPTMAGHAYLKQRSIERRRAIITGIVSVALSVIASVLATLITK